MNRDAAIERLADPSERWDVLIIGGGATGLGCAVDAAARGWRVALVEQHDFGKGASSRSTKLIHGGVRYLRQGRISMVRQSLRERWRLLCNAPQLVFPLGFAIPCYRRRDVWFYGAGLKLYDALAGSKSLGRSRCVGKRETTLLLPTIDEQRLVGGVYYLDAQFDDAGLAVALARTANELGATVANYCPVVRLLKRGSHIVGAALRDDETQVEHEVRAKVVLNATGAFADRVRLLDDEGSEPMLGVSQGAHVVLDKHFLPGDTALMIPKTDDGRVLFAIPWLDRVLVGTTDVPRPAAEIEPRPLAVEIDFILSHAARYLVGNPTRSDVLSTFAGLRPLIQRTVGDRAPKEHRETKSLSREHATLVSAGGLVTATGGKWTTYRTMSADAIDWVERVGGLPRTPCSTANLKLVAPYGYSRDGLRAQDVEHAARREMARTLEDVLARRSRMLLLDARAAMRQAPRVAAWLAAALGRDATWQDQQVDAFERLAAGYLPGPADE